MAEEISGLRHLDGVKRLAAKKVLEQVLRYIDKDPERNVERILELGERLALLPWHKEGIRNIRKEMAAHPAVIRFIYRLCTEVDPHVRHTLAVNYFLNALFFGEVQRKKFIDQGIMAPNLITIDPTSACNLRCRGCWAGNYDQHDSLPLETLDRVISEGKRMGTYYITFLGGEPTLYPHLFTIMERHPDVAFQVYTNSLLVDERFVDRLVELGNAALVFSLEGPEEFTDARRGRGVFQRIVRAMELMQRRKGFFGVAFTITRENCYTIMGDEFLDFLIDKGCFFGWSFHYIPVGRNPDPEMMVTLEQREWLADRIIEVRRTKPLQIADFWNDGEITMGCIAAGRAYLHINARGDVEPCAFVHFANDNIKEKSLKECLQSPLFQAYHRRQPFDRNHLRPCPIIDHPEMLREIVGESAAKPTEPGAEEILGGPLAGALDERAAAWVPLADAIWRRRHPQAEIPSPRAVTPA